MISNGAGCDTVSVTDDEEPSLPPNGPLTKLTKYIPLQGVIQLG